MKPILIFLSLLLTISFPLIMFFIHCWAITLNCDKDWADGCCTATALVGTLGFGVLTGFITADYLKDKPKWS